jgi:hypothetical protein
MARLDAEIGDLQASGDSDRAALSIAEREWLAGELAAAPGRAPAQLRLRRGAGPDRGRQGDPACP